MYEIKVLNSNDFDKVAKSDPRYEYVDESNLGFADRMKGVCYVRDTKIHDLNKYLIDHELEELEQDESTHEDPNGIRHKKFWDFIKSWFSPITKSVQAIASPFGAFSGGQKQQEQPQSGSYAPSSGSSSPTSGFSSPMNLFQGEQYSGSYSPANVPSSVTGSSGVGGGLSEEVLKNLRGGNYSGRLTF